MSKKSSEPRYLDTKTKAYYRQILKELNEARKIVEKEIIGKLEEIRGETRLDSEMTQEERLDAENKLLKRMQEAFAFVKGAFFGQKLEPGMESNLVRYGNFVERMIVTGMIKGLQSAQFSKFKRQHKKIQGVDPIKRVPGLQDLIDMATANNVEKIKSISSGYFDRVYEIVSDGFQGGDLNRTIAKKIELEFDVSKKKAALLARDQVASINGQLERALAKGNGITKYIWHTNMDGREREDHAKLDGTEQSWDNPPITVTTGKRAGERNHPGEDIQCRCYAENIYED